MFVLIFLANGNVTIFGLRGWLYWEPCKAIPVGRELALGHTYSCSVMYFIYKNQTKTHSYLSESVSIPHLQIPKSVSPVVPCA